MTDKSKYGNRQTGYTLVELMVAVGIVGVMLAIAVPTYQGYISTSSAATAKTNAKQLAGFEDTYFYENDTYLAGVYDPSTSTDDLTAALDWKPTGDDDLFRYEVTVGSTGDITTSYTITVTMISDSSVTATVSKP